MNPQTEKAWFIAGTDTNVGKTFVTCALLHGLREQGITAIGMKPVAAGTDEQGKNDDVEALMTFSAEIAPRELCNPYCFNEAIAPHIAAEKAHVKIEIAPITLAFHALCQQANVVLVEGVGGFCVPLSATLTTADLARALNVPVILVVGMRLGCINHALLTAEAIRARGLTLAGWIANQIDAAMPCFEENLTALKERMHAPLLGVIPSRSTPESAAAYIHWDGR